MAHLASACRQVGANLDASSADSPDNDIRPDAGRREAGMTTARPRTMVLARPINRGER